MERTWWASSSSPILDRCTKITTKDLEVKRLDLFPGQMVQKTLKPGFGFISFNSISTCY